MDPGGLGYQLIEAGLDEVGELDLTIAFVPVAAIPIPNPMMSASETGVLNDRAAPKASVSPAVALNTPPFGSATSSPNVTVSS